MSLDQPVDVRVRFGDQLAIEHVPEDHVALLLVPAAGIDGGR